MQLSYRLSALAIAITICTAASQPAAAEDKQVCLEDVCFDSQTMLGKKSVPLRGIAKFEYLFFDVYTLALYAADESGDLLGAKPKQLVFHYHRKVSRAQMIEGADKNLASNPDVSKTAYNAELAKINSWYTDVQPDDRYTLTFIPGSGLSLSKNGNLLGTVAGDRFANDYLGIWLSDYPLSRDLRDRLLRRP